MVGKVHDTVSDVPVRDHDVSSNLLLQLFTISSIYVQPPLLVYGDIANSFCKLLYKEVLPRHQ